MGRTEPMPTNGALLLQSPCANRGIYSAIKYSPIKREFFVWASNSAVSGSGLRSRLRASLTCDRLLFTYNGEQTGVQCEALPPPRRYRCEYESHRLPLDLMRPCPSARAWASPRELGSRGELKGAPPCLPTPFPCVLRRP